MFPYSKSVNPAVRTHLDSQVAYLNDLSNMMSHSFQQLCQANIQLSQTMLEETVIAGQRMFTTENGPEAFGAAASRAQPASDKLRAYQQHISQLAANAQVELARVNEQHAPKTSQSAQELVKEVKRVAVEETDRNLRQQEEALQKFRDPFQREATANQGSWADRTGANMQSDTQAKQGQQGQQNQQSDGARNQSAQSTQQPSNRGVGKRPD
jgi:phasin family protein